MNVNEPSLFDDLESDTPTWREVPQALFDGWPARQQSAYCAARDEDAATTALDEDWRQFYLQRAAAYRSDMA